MARRTASRRQSPQYESVRRLEKIERGATVFYEVSRQGKWVMVRSGHVGLPGQTRMREYPTPPAASVAMERLVEDRLKEGWLEPSAETPPTAPPEEQPGKPRVGRETPVPALPDTRTVQSAVGGGARTTGGTDTTTPARQVSQRSRSEVEHRTAGAIEPTRAARAREAGEAGPSQAATTGKGRPRAAKSGKAAAKKKPGGRRKKTD